MDFHNAEIVEKLKLIFESFLQENFAITNSVYFEKLISHISAKENAYVLQEPFALEWVEKCINIISEDFNKLNPKVVSFMFHFCSLMTRNEWIIIEIRDRRIMDRILTILKRDVHQFTPSMKLGIIRLLSAVSSFSFGMAYIRTTKAWSFLIDYCNKDHTLYVVREARQLLYELLYKFSVKINSEELVLEMLDAILKPLHDNAFKEHTDNMMVNVDDSELQQKLSPTLDLISFIFQKTLESEEKTNIAHLCEVHHNLQVTIWKHVEMTQNQFFLEKILATLSSFNFAKLVYEKWKSGQIAAENFNEFGVNFFNMMKFCVTRRECVNFLKLAELNHVLWKKLGQRAPKEIQIENYRVQFENQLITFHLLPVLFILKSKEHHKEEIFDNYIMKLFEISCEHTLRICYAYREIQFSAQESAVQLAADLAYKSIHGILSMETILDRDQAVLVFQAMIYALKEFTLESRAQANVGYNGNEASNNTNNKQLANIDLIVEIPNVLYAAFVGLQTLIDRYKITWKESIETICIVSFVSELLENPNMSSRLVVQALKLVQISIEHFLSPNMALLVDNLQGSSLLRLGPIIIKRFHDTAWEVRDSALELVNSITEISRRKFTAFQQIIMGHNFWPIVYQMAKNDSEPYVRATAFKCISQMIPINVIWESVSNKEDLIEHLFFVLYNESEGIVRNEAVNALKNIYDYRKIPSNYTDTLYSTLCYCVVADLHWEVKVTGLKFWELEIEKQLTNQGMIDGTFPTVTFSKENKKIVTLTEKEIKIRIKKVFNELSRRGCLGVILKCLSDECDLQVVKMSVCIIKRLTDKLNKYDYESVIDDMENNGHSDVPLASICNNSNNQTFPESQSIATDTQHADEVIDGILASQDINLLISAYEKQMQVCEDDEAGKSIETDYYKTFAKVSAKEFVGAIRRIDLEELLQNHNKWLMCVESFSSLLDDLLSAIQPQDTFTSDCY